MSERSFEEILDERLDVLRAGATIEECVAPYPQHAERLREQLLVAQDLLSARPQTTPAASAVAAGRSRLLAAAADQRLNSTREPSRGFVSPLPALFGDRSLFTLLPRALPAVIAMLVLGGAAWGVSAATTGDAGPGGWFESSSSTGQRIEVRGTITAIDTAMLTITVATPDGDVRVQVNAQTQFDDENGASLTLDGFAVGDGVKISAFRDDTGALIAREVEHDDEGDIQHGDDDGQNDDVGDGQENDNSGPGNADGDAEATDEPDDNSGPGNAEDDEADEDNSGPGNAEDDEADEDNSGPGNAEDDEADEDNSGPGSGSDDDDESSGSGGDSGHGGGDDD